MNSQEIEKGMALNTTAQPEKCALAEEAQRSAAPADIGKAAAVVDQGKTSLAAWDSSTIQPHAAAERFELAVKTKRINMEAMSPLEMTIEQLMTDDGQSPVLYVPHKYVVRIIRLFGGHTMMDFDKYYGFNNKIGAPYLNCYLSMMSYMNMLNGNMRDQWEKVSHDPLLSDVFNIVQSAVRSRIGECKWYE